MQIKKYKLAIMQDESAQRASVFHKTIVNMYEKLSQRHILHAFTIPQNVTVEGDRHVSLIARSNENICDLFVLFSLFLYMYILHEYITFQKMK